MGTAVADFETHKTAEYTLSLSRYTLGFLGYRPLAPKSSM